jgi:putative ABC transport system permease protein
MGIQLLRGRVFEDADREGRPLVAVISESAAQRFWPDRNPIGERFAIDDPEITIVGVVADVHAAALDRAPQPTVYVPYRQDPWPFMTFALRTEAAPATLTAAVRDAIWRVDKDQPVGVVLTMDQQLSNSLTRRRFSVTLLTAFGVVAPRWRRSASTACWPSTSHVGGARSACGWRSVRSRGTSSPMSSATGCASPAWASSSASAWR